MMLCLFNRPPATKSCESCQIEGVTTLGKVQTSKTKNYPPIEIKIFVFLIALGDFDATFLSFFLEYCSPSTNKLFWASFGDEPPDLYFPHRHSPTLNR